MIELDKPVDLSVSIDVWGTGCSNCTYAAPFITFCTTMSNNSVSARRSNELITAYKMFFRYLEQQGGIVLYGTRHFPRLIVADTSESLNEVNFFTLYCRQLVFENARFEKVSFVWKRALHRAETV